MKTKIMLLSAAIAIIASSLWLFWHGMQASVLREQNMHKMEQALHDYQKLPEPCAQASAQNLLNQLQLAARASPKAFASLGQTTSFVTHNLALQQQLKQAMTNACEQRAANALAIEKQCKSCHRELRGR